MHDRKSDIPLTIKFRVIPLISLRKISNDWNSVALKSVGTDGLSFLCNENLDVGSLIDLKIDFPEIGHTTHGIGEIDRIEQFQPSSLFSITVKLKEMERQEKEIIETIVEEMEEAENEIPVTYSQEVNPLSYITNRPIPISFVSP
jgi:hypothetical protein